MDIQRVRIKLFADAPSDVDVAPILDIFSRWRHDGDHPASWIDLADYAHVPQGPLALLVGHQGNLGFDLEDGRPGLVWRNKAALAGDAEARLSEALRRGLALFAALARDDAFPGDIQLDPGRLAIDLVDRMVVGDHDVAERELRPAVQAVLDRLYGLGAYEARRRLGPGRPFGYEVEARAPRDLDVLLARLGLADDDANDAAPEVESMEVKRVGANEAAQLIEREGYVYVDVRSLGEFQAGHPKGAYNIPIMIEGPAGYSLVPNRAFVDVVEAHFDKDAKLIVGCRSGGRSLRAAQILVASGYTQVIDNYSGFEAGQGPQGVELGWGRSGLPVASAAEPGRSWQELVAKVED